jgi:hypothetical protein
MCTISTLDRLEMGEKRKMCICKNCSICTFRHEIQRLGHIILCGAVVGVIVRRGCDFCGDPRNSCEKCVPAAK